MVEESSARLTSSCAHARTLVLAGAESFPRAHTHAADCSFGRGTRAPTNPLKTRADEGTGSQIKNGRAHLHTCLPT
eukprot:5176999-Pleurochrysis_carterae.AAC.3